MQRISQTEVLYIRDAVNIKKRAAGRSLAWQSFLANKSTSIKEGSQCLELGDEIHLMYKVWVITMVSLCNMSFLNLLKSRVALLTKATLYAITTKDIKWVILC